MYVCTSVDACLLPLRTLRSIEDFRLPFRPQKPETREHTVDQIQAAFGDTVFSSGLQVKLQYPYSSNF